MKKALNFTLAIIIVIFTYTLYVVDNILCSFGLGTRLPFDDFQKSFFVQKLAFIHVGVFALIAWLWFLIF